MRKDVRNILLKLLLFAMPFVVLFAFLETRARRIPNSYFIKRTNLENHLDSLQILVLGSSQAFDDVDPESLGFPGYNLANVSQSLFYDSRLALKYLDQMPHLKLVVLTISDFSFGYEMSNLPESWREYFYLHYFGIRHPSLDITDPRYYFHFALYPRAFLTDLLRGRPLDPTYFDSIRNNGWRAVPPPENPVEENDPRCRELAAFHASIRKEEMVPATAGYLEALLTELRQRNIQAVFVVLPTSDCYARWVDPAILQKNNDILISFGKKYGVLAFDYLTDSRFSDADFADPDHLNARGAQKFSLILRDEVIDAVWPLRGR